MCEISCGDARRRLAEENPHELPAEPTLAAREILARYAASHPDFAETLDDELHALILRLLEDVQEKPELAREILALEQF